MTQPITIQVRSFYGDHDHLSSAIEAAEQDANDFLALLDPALVVSVQTQTLSTLHASDTGTPITTSHVSFYTHVITVVYRVQP